VPPEMSAFGHFSDIQPTLTNFRFWERGGHESKGLLCPLMTQSGHCPDGVGSDELGQEVRRPAHLSTHPPEG